MKILYIHQDGKFTGSALSLSYLIQHLDRSKYEPWVLIAEDGPARQLFESVGAKVAVQYFPRYWTAPGPRLFSRATWKQQLFFMPQPDLKKWVKMLSPALIHVNDKAAAPAGFTLRKMGIPIVQQLRSTYASTDSSLNAWVSRNMIRHFADAFVAISEDELDGFEDLPNEIVFNSIDLEKAARAAERRLEIRTRHGISQHDFLIGYLGLVSPVRGIWNFLELAKRSLEFRSRQETQHGVPAFKFMVVGALPQDEPQKNQLAERVKNLGLKEQVTFTDFQQDSLGYLAAFDVLIVCNEHGVLGRPPLEALAVGTPCVAFAGHSGKSRILVDGLNSRIVRRGDVAGLAEAMFFLAENPAVYTQMRRAANAYAPENFSPEANARKVMDVYERLLPF